MERHTDSTRRLDPRRPLVPTHATRRSQGLDDDELPERMLGGVRMPFVDPLTAFPPWTGEH